MRQVPSTINRLYQFVHQTNPSFVLNLISATVLPLQGAWNATIYIYTTRNESKRTYVSLKSKLTDRARSTQRQSHALYQKNPSTSSRGHQNCDEDIQLEGNLRQYKLG